MLTEDLAGDLQDNAGIRMHDNVWIELRPLRAKKEHCFKF